MSADLSKATPRPWEVREDEEVAAQGEPGSIALCWKLSPIAAADAALIGKAVNLHDELVAAIRFCLEDGLLGAHNSHWDAQGNSGRTCPACMANLAAKDRLTAALAKVDAP